MKTTKMMMKTVTMRVRMAAMTIKKQGRTRREMRVAIEMIPMMLNAATTGEG